MACPEKNCDLTAVSATLSGTGGTFTFTEYVGEGDLVEFGDTDYEYTAQYSNTKNKSRFSGETIPNMDVTLNLFPCDPVYETLYQAHIKNTLMCFTLVVNDPCCNVRRFKDIIITSMSPTNVSTGDAVSVLNLRGTPIQ